MRAEHDQVVAFRLIGNRLEEPSLDELDLDGNRGTLPVRLLLGLGQDLFGDGADLLGRHAAVAGEARVDDKQERHRGALVIREAHRPGLSACAALASVDADEDFLDHMLRPFG